MKVAYIAHPLSGNIQKNREKAIRWVCWLTKTFDIAPVADWIILTALWDEETGRTRGLEVDKVLITRCDIIILTGGTISSGMQIELDHANRHNKLIVDFSVYLEPVDVPLSFIEVIKKRKIM